MTAWTLVFILSSLALLIHARAERRRRIRDARELIEARETIRELKWQLLAFEENLKRQNEDDIEQILGEIEDNN